MQVRLRKDSLDLYDSFPYIPHLGFLVPNVTDMKMAGKFECLFTSNHYFEQSRSVRLVVEPALQMRTNENGVTTVRYAGGGIDDYQFGGENRARKCLESKLISMTFILVISATALSWL